MATGLRRSYAVPVYVPVRRRADVKYRDAMSDYFRGMYFFSKIVVTY